MDVLARWKNENEFGPVSYGKFTFRWKHDGGKQNGV